MPNFISRDAPAPPARPVVVVVVALVAVAVDSTWVPTSVAGLTQPSRSGTLDLVLFRYEH